MFINPTTLIFSISIILILSEYGTTGIESSDYTNITILKVSRSQRPLQKINKLVVRSIHSPDGDIIDCISLHKQPAFGHPLLKNHKIQTRASSKPWFKDEKILQNYTITNKTQRVWQVWQTAGHCPKGTVPIYRTPIDNIQRANLLHYGKKGLKLYNARNVATQNEDDPDLHEYAAAFTNKQTVYGAKATINIWDPLVQSKADELSLSQIWITAGNDVDLNTIEAGWQVYPQLYNDSQPRLFTYWTSDGYDTTGCYNLLCPGFVQISKKLVAGARMAPVSSYGGDQHEMELFMWKDQNTKNWWLSYGDMDIGYWPAEIFTHLKDYGTTAIWGGEVVNEKHGGRHTSTQMGSGRFPGEGYRKASYFRRLQLVSSSSSSISSSSPPPQNLSVVVTAADCYDIKLQSASDNDWGTYFYYGGPGNNPKCP